MSPSSPAFMMCLGETWDVEFCDHGTPKFGAWRPLGFFWKVRHRCGEYTWAHGNYCTHCSLALTHNERTLPGARAPLARMSTNGRYPA